MVSDIAIINLQVVASILMGYEFFISSKMKGAIDKWAEIHAKSLKATSLEEVKAQVGIIKKHTPYYVTAVVFLVFGLASFKLISVFESNNFIWLAILIGFVAIFFIVGAFKSVLDKLIIEGLAPMIIPLGKWVLALYLLFTAKGVISGVGFIFLIASFVCRYHNAVYA